MFVSSLVSPWALLLLPIIYYILPYLRNWALLKVPGPLPAALSNLWLMYQCRRGRRYQAVDDLHKTYGKVVRIQPNHVSIADDSVINTIYGHGNGFLKRQGFCSVFCSVFPISAGRLCSSSLATLLFLPQLASFFEEEHSLTDTLAVTNSEYYDAFVSIRRGLFNTRDRAEHTRKRKVVSHTFSAKSIGQFEQYIHANLELFVQKWNKLSDTRANPSTGYASIDALHWFNYLAFDIIGDLAFGQPFGMLEREKDYAEIRKSPDAPPTSAPAIEVLNRRGEVSGTLGCLPQLKPWAKYMPDPFFSKGVEAVENLAGIAIARVKQRLDNPTTDRVDLLARLMEGKDAKGEKLGREELTAEALTQLIAGSDTTSNTACALLYYVVRTPGVLETLREELDAAIPPGVPSYDSVKDLEYVQWVINETMRIHSTSSLGLPRLVPGATPENPNPAGVDILGYHFPPGTALSVPSYTIHHSKEIWGPDADDFVPGRWSEKRLTPRQKDAFIPFSTGPRACVGRNVAEMELKCMVATVFKNFEFRDEHPGPMETREGFLRKPVGFNVGLRRRRV